MGTSRLPGLPREVSPAEARSAIAAAIHDSGEHVLLGTIELQAHQAEAVKRLRDAIREFGGALNCDPVGTGKTFTALALARSYDSVLVVAPAFLRQMWEMASAAAAVEVDFVSHEALSRSGRPRKSAAFVIVDEAHHARNPATQRYLSLASITSGRDVVLLTATPVHNRRDDLVALISLFLGSRASALSDAELGRVIVRRERALVPAKVGIPRIAPLEWEVVPDDGSIPRAILGIPPPLPVRDGGDGGILVINSLVRQWASSDAALRGGLVRRRQRSIAMISALESGTWPTRAELRAWTIAEDSVQLGFAELLATPTPAPDALLAAVRAHHDGVCEILKTLEAPSARDRAMAEGIRRIRDRHSGKRIVAFSQYEDTVSAMFRALASDGRVAAFGGAGGRVSGGTITRSETLARFAPESTGASRAADACDVSLLLATDLLSEGVNLQDAAVAIHLDFPWTPARLEQRIGRIARMGSHHDLVHTYAFRPPSSAERIVGITRILNVKAREAGIAGDNPRTVEALRELVSTWLADPGMEDGCVASAVAAPVTGFIAACRTGHFFQLIGSIDGVTGDDPELLYACARLAEGFTISVDRRALEHAIAGLESHFAAAGALSGAASTGHSDPAVRILRRIASIVTRAKPVDRPRITALAHAARAAVLRRHGAHRENELADLAGATMTDDELLVSLTEGQCGTPESRRGPPDVQLRAIILFIPPGASRAASPAPALFPRPAP